MKHTMPILAGLVSAAVLSSLMPEAARSQDDAVATARAGVDDLGKRFNGEVLAATGALYADLQRHVDDGGINVTADIKYGPDALQAFDLFVPGQTPATPAPIVVYLHGGGLVGGDKISGGTDGYIYSNVAKFFARHGMIGVNANYRLVPDVKWPGGPDDIRAVLQWLRREHSRVRRRCEQDLSDGQLRRLDARSSLSVPRADTARRRTRCRRCAPELRRFRRGQPNYDERLFRRRRILPGKRTRRSDWSRPTRVPLCLSSCGARNTIPPASRRALRRCTPSSA